MADAAENGKTKGKLWIALAALAVVSGVSYDHFFRTRQKGGARTPIGVIIPKIEQGDEVEKMVAIRGLYGDITEPAEVAQVYPYLIRAMTDEAEMVREVAATLAGDLILRFGKSKSRTLGDFARKLVSNTPSPDLPEPTVVALCPKAEQALTALLDDSSPTIRARAAKSLGYAAEFGKLDTPPPRLVDCLDDESDFVRATAVDALIEYRKGPESLVPVALRRLPNETATAGEAFTMVFWHIRLEPSVLPLLIEGLASEKLGVRLVCTAAINHMGQEAGPALPAILALLRKEMQTPHSSNPYASMRTMAMAAGAIGEISPATEPLPGTVELLCEALKSPSAEPESTDPNRPAAPAASRKDLHDQIEFRQAEAAWSLGILGRYAAPAVPLLLSTFEAAPGNAEILRGIVAEALAEITRGTPDDDRVIAVLAKAWKTAPAVQKTAFARALRTLGPKSEQILPELKQAPTDETGSQIRRVRYPRTRREAPRRE